MKRTYRIGVKRAWNRLCIGFEADRNESTNIPFASWASELIIIASESVVKSNLKK